MKDFVLYEKLCDLAEWLFPIAERWPKHEKFILVTQTKNCVHDMTRIAIRATHRKPRKANAKRARRRIKRLAGLCAKGEDKEEALRSVRASFYGYTKFCSAATTWNKIAEDLR